MDVAIELASPSDDAGIRGLVARQVTPGRIRFVMPREPEFAPGCAVTGDDYRILVARATERQEIVGVACRSTRSVFVNGSPRRVGYLSQLRVDERFRGRWLVSRGFARMAQMDREDPVCGYLASIVDGNDTATAVLVRKPRRNFPVFREVAHYRTLALPSRRPKAPLDGDEEIDLGSAGQLGEIAAFLRSQGVRRQFFSVWTEGSLRALDSLGLRAADIRVARRAGDIVGVVALWDQTAYKQAIVRGYTGWLKLLAPMTRLAGSWLPVPPLPHVGTELRSAYASLVCIAHDDLRVFGRLLRSIFNLASSRRFDYLLVGLDARDPLLPVVHRYQHVAYPSRLYLAAWPDGPNGDFAHEPLNGAPAYVDIATL